LKKQVDVEKTIIAKMFEKEVNFLLKGWEERQLAKKGMIFLVGQFLNFFLSKIKRGCAIERIF
jgi:hypothetical protein